MGFTYFLLGSKIYWKYVRMSHAYYKYSKEKFAQYYKKSVTHATLHAKKLEELRSIPPRFLIHIYMFSKLSFCVLTFAANKASARAYKTEHISLPIFGYLAERSLPWLDSWAVVCSIFIPFQLEYKICLAWLLSGWF